MADEHGGHAHNHAAGANSKMLAIALGLTTTFLIDELIGSFVFNSLALLSDAAHMFTDSAALAIALAAVKIGQRPADDARTFGYRRFEILAAAFNALLLFAVAGYVLYEGIARFFTPSEVQSTGMLVVAAIGDIPNVEWLQDSGLLTDGRLVADARGRVAPGIVAAGDVAHLPVRGIVRRIPLWNSAIEQARVAAVHVAHRLARCPRSASSSFFVIATVPAARTVPSADLT